LESEGHDSETDDCNRMGGQVFGRSEQYRSESDIPIRMVTAQA
jgi:hypothetical protein